MHVERRRNLRLVWDTGEKFMSYMWVYSGLEIIYYKEKVSKKKIKRGDTNDPYITIIFYRLPFASTNG